MKYRLLLRKLSISSPYAAIRFEWPLPIKLMTTMLSVMLCVAIAYWAYDMGRRSANIDSASALPPALPQPAAVQHIEQASQNRLADQLRLLEAENARLKEEVAFFNNVLPSASSGPGINIQGLMLEQTSPTQLRFRTLVMKGGNVKQKFSGQLQFVVTATNGSETLHLIFPNEQTPDPDKFKIGFRQYQNLEGSLTLPDGLTVKQVQARILENGHIRVQRETVPVSANRCNT